LLLLLLLPLLIFVVVVFIFGASDGLELTLRSIVAFVVLQMPCKYLITKHAYGKRRRSGVQSALQTWSKVAHTTGCGRPKRATERDSKSERERASASRKERARSLYDSIAKRALSI